MRRCFKKERKIKEKKQRITCIQPRKLYILTLKYKYYFLFYSLLFQMAIKVFTYKDFGCLDFQGNKWSFKCFFFCFKGAVGYNNKKPLQFQRKHKGGDHPFWGILTTQNSLTSSVSVKTHFMETNQKFNTHPTNTDEFDLFVCEFIFLRIFFFTVYDGSLIFVWSV